MRATQAIEYMKMKHAPSAEEEATVLTHITLTPRIKSIRKAYRLRLAKEKRKPND